MTGRILVQVKQQWRWHRVKKLQLK